MAATRPTNSLQSKKGCGLRALRRRRLPRWFPSGGHQNPSRRHQNPSPPQRNPSPAQQNPSPAQQNPNAFSFRESRFLNGLNVDSGPARGLCDSTAQATSPSCPFARVFSEKLNHMLDDSARKCQFEIFPHKRPFPKQATNAFHRSGRGAARRPMRRLARRAQDYPASNRSDCGPGPVGEAASLSRQLHELRGNWNAEFGPGGGVIRSGGSSRPSIDVQQVVRLQTLSDPQLSDRTRTQGRLFRAHPRG